MAFVKTGITILLNAVYRVIQTVLRIRPLWTKLSIALLRVHRYRCTLPNRIQTASDGERSSTKVFFQVASSLNEFLNIVVMTGQRYREIRMLLVLAYVTEEPSRKCWNFVRFLTNRTELA